MTVMLETERFCIRTPSLNDLPHWLALHAELKTHTDSPDTIKKWLMQDIQHFKKYGFSMGSVYEKNRDTFIGRAGLVYLDYDSTQPDIEVGYELHPLYWGKGYATELAKGIVDWGFHHLQVSKLVAVTRPENRKSQRVLEKMGMQYRQVITFREEDFFYYDILNPHNPSV